MNKLLLLFLLFLAICGESNAQFFGQVPTPKKYTFKQVYDSTYGINVFEKLNLQLGGDSVRNDKRGYAVQGWQEDIYESGQLLHKGYYVDGQLKVYKNYYENGQIERVFKVTDLKSCNMQIFFPDGKLKSDVDYHSAAVRKQTDYYPDGQIEYTEENAKGGEYLILRKSFFKNGKPESIFEMTEKKSKTYNKKEYYENGNIKEEGILKYDPVNLDYVKDGIYKMYDEHGKLISADNYIKGQLTK